jgi:hypothetical protein
MLEWLPKFIARRADGGDFGSLIYKALRIPQRRLVGKPLIHLRSILFIGRRHCQSQ